MAAQVCPCGIIRTRRNTFAVTRTGVINSSMAKISKVFACPNCGKTFEKDYALMHLSTGTKFVDVELGASMSAEGGYRETVYCKNCRGPIDTKALIEGKFDVRDRSLIWFAIWVLAIAALVYYGQINFWIASAMVTVILVTCAVIMRKISLRRMRQYNQSLGSPTPR